MKKVKFETNTEYETCWKWTGIENETKKMINERIEKRLGNETQ